MNLKALFSTPKKAAVSIVCLLVILATAGVCIVYAVNANSPVENSSIGSESAQNFAFADAGVDPVSAQAVKVKFERYQDGFVYEVEFIAGDTEYEYKIDAADGSVIKKELKTVKGPDSTDRLPAAVAITLEEAQNIALTDAGVDREQAVFTEAKEDWEGGSTVYELQFYAGNVEYEYEINARTGAIYSKKTTTYVAQDPGGTPSAAPRPSAPAQTAPPTAQPTQPPASSQPQPTTAPTTAPTQPPATAAPQPTQSGGSLYIGMDAAKGVALADAGLSADQVRFTKARMDYEDGVAVYEIEFSTAAHEYEYEINAKTGAIYKREVEAFSNGHHTDNHSPSPSQNQTADSYIGTEKAKAVALGRVGFTADQVVFTKVELDHDDGRAIYEIEFRKDGVEYELEIDAITGDVLKYEMDRD